MNDTVLCRREFAIRATISPLPSFVWKSNFAAGSPQLSENTTPTTKFESAGSWASSGSFLEAEKSYHSMTAQQHASSKCASKEFGSALKILKLPQSR
jgi:hypothetical protein